VTRSTSRRGALVLLALLGVCVGCDHAAKQIAQRVLDPGAGLSLACETVRFELVQNHGAFLGLGAAAPAPLRRVLLLGLVPVALAAVCLLAWRAAVASRASLVGLALFAGGGAANWLDRVLHGGAVTDYVSIGLGPLRTGVCNLADAYVLIGGALLLLASRRRSGAA
jgi:signal peptidase II